MAELIAIIPALAAIVIGIVLMFWAPWQMVKILYEGYKPLLLSALKNPRFSVRTMFGLTVIFAIAFTFMRMTGLFDHWENSWVNFIAAIVLGGVCLMLAVGLACALDLLWSETVTILSTAKHRKVDQPPDFGFLNQLAETPVDTFPLIAPPDDSHVTEAAEPKENLEKVSLNSESSSAASQMLEDVTGGTRDNGQQ